MGWGQAQPILSLVDGLLTSSGNTSLILLGSDLSPIIQSTYSSELSTTSATFSRTACAAQQYHYEALQFTVTVNDSFAFYSESDMHTFGMIYEHAFDQSKPSQGRITFDDESCGISKHFGIRISLKVNTTYILVVTTVGPLERGHFTVIVLGPAHVELQHISK